MIQAICRRSIQWNLSWVTLAVPTIFERSIEVISPKGVGKIVNNIRKGSEGEVFNWPMGKGMDGGQREMYRCSGVVHECGLDTNETGRDGGRYRSKPVHSFQ